MNINSIFLATALSITCFSVQSAETIQHKHARVVLDAINVSYVVIQRDDDIEIITYNYKTPAETCKFLTDKGVTVQTVSNNVTSNENGSIVTTVSNC